MPLKTSKREFWVTNLATNKDISLTDLRVTIRKCQTVNLLDEKHYHLTYEQLEESLKNGSLKKRERWIKVRNLPPRYPVEPGLYTTKALRLQPPRNASVKVEYKTYNDLGDESEVNREVEEKIANEYADIIQSDNIPALAKDPKLKEEIAEVSSKFTKDNEEFLDDD